MSINLNNGVPGNTTGNVIATGYVGEIQSTPNTANLSTVSSPSFTVGTAGTNWVNATSTLPLTAGVWLLIGQCAIETSAPNTGGIDTDVAIVNATDTTVLAQSGGFGFM